MPAKRSKKTQKRISVYFDDEAAEAIKKAAERDGMAVTTWVRDAALAVATSGKSPRRRLDLE